MKNITLITVKFPLFLQYVATVIRYISQNNMWEGVLFLSGGVCCQLAATLEPLKTN